ncbi:prefoldin subunit 2-like [Panonychus citri]|uniref:prefoldin subunit 2-like n=1 Tax=Panonychus citri TaxID=50023 RepID=UPI0023073014|nr:prefoldin subunit 2-like [Panonychus citri]
MADDKGKTKAKSLTNEQILAGFNQLRQAQRSINNKIIELENDLNEHVLVIDALKAVDPSRKCFRSIGGVLVERNVKEVLPSVIENKEMIGKTIEALKSKCVEKGQEINDYMDKHNIKIRQEPYDKSEPQDNKSVNEASSSGILVADSSAKVESQ